jgi:hypothetical protein
MIFKSKGSFEARGRGKIFFVTLPMKVKPTSLLGSPVVIDGAPYVCTGLESRGPARPGMEVGMVVRPPKGK